MSSFRRRQSSDYNQSVPETEFVPESHMYQEKHFQPTLNQPVAEGHSETEYGSTVTPDKVESRADRAMRSNFMESSDQPGEEDLLNGQIQQNIQGNSDPGTQYSTPDVSSGVSSGSGGFTGYETSAVTAASSTTAASTVVATSTAATISSVAVASVGAVMVAATLILPLIVGVPSAIVFEDISVTDTTVYYSIYFEDYEEDMDLTVSLHNNFTDRSHTVESGSISILEEDLKPGMDYKITVYGSMGTVLEEKSVRTEKSPSAPALDVRSFDYRPQDGKVVIDSEMSGDTSRLSGYRAAVYTNIDGVRTELCSSDLATLGGEQSIPLTITKDKKYSATFVIEAVDQNGDTLELYSNDFTVYGTPYYSTPTFNLSNDRLQVICGYYDPYSARTDYELVTKVMNSESAEPVITHTPLNSGETVIENISGGHAVFEMMAYIQYTEGGSTVVPQDSTYDYNSLDDLVTTGTGRVVEIPQSSPQGELEITVGNCTESLKAIVRVFSQDSGTYSEEEISLNNGTTGTYTINLRSSVNYNTELQFYVEVEGTNPMQGAYGTVVFAYASYTGDYTTRNLNPATNGPGIELLNFAVDDPYHIWSDYRVTVKQVGASVVTLCSNEPIVDNKVKFTNTEFQNGTAYLTITCIQDGATVIIADGVTLSTDVYSGPTVSTSYYLNEITSDVFTLDISLYAEFDEFGSSTEPKELYAFLYCGDYSASSSAFDYQTSSLTFNLPDSEFPRGDTYSMQIKEKVGDNLVLIVSLEDAAAKQV